MKRPRKLTVAEREYLQSMKIVADNWMISKKTSERWLLVHKFTNIAKIIPAP